MDVGVQVLVLAWIVLFVVMLQWSRVNNRGVSIATWLGLTVVTWWLEVTIAFVALHVILFELGREATAIVLIVTIAIMTVTPAVWAYALGRWNKYRSAHP